jgi:hypothetical protein
VLLHANRPLASTVVRRACIRGGSCEARRDDRLAPPPPQRPAPHGFGAVAVHGQRASTGGAGATAAPGPAEAARRAAFVRCQIAYEQLAGLGPPGPPGRGDRGEEARLRARGVALRVFGEALNMEQVTEIVGEMRNRLAPRLATVTAPAGDKDCGNRAAYVRGFRPPVVLCPAFFRSTPEEQTRTMVHEAAHLARIGEPMGESYCAVFDCESSCGGFDVADSWAHLVHCLSGRTPDKPETITAP